MTHHFHAVGPRAGISLPLRGLLAAILVAAAFAWLAPVVHAAPWHVVTNRGSYYVRITPEPDPLPLNEYFTLQVTVFDNDDRTQRIEDVEVKLDAGMPQHRHGMNTQPEVQRVAPGRFVVRGMLFHMRGQWTMSVFVTRAGREETAELQVDCCGA